MRIFSKKKRITDSQFVKEVRKYELIYDKSCKGFQDRRVKGNCWKKIAEAERRYKTIRTAFSWYLAKVNGRLGSGVSEVGSIDPKYEHMRWLMPFIKSRQSSSNLNPPRSADNQDELEAPDPDLKDLLNEDGRGEKQTEDQDWDPCKRKTTTLNKESQGQSLKKRKKDSDKIWIGSNISVKAQLKKTDCQINQTITSLDKTLELLKSQRNNVQERDGDFFYCMSLTSRLRSIGPREKAFAKNRIEKVLLEIEFGYPSRHSTPAQDQGLPLHLNRQHPTSSYIRDTSQIFVDETSNNTYQEL